MIKAKCRTVWNELKERLGNQNWWEDVEGYYGVTKREAIKLGTRAKGRRPDLPGSATCEPVRGKTLEEIWHSRLRDSEEAIFSFYREVGSWFVFRQLVRHRGRSYGFIARHLQSNGVLAEFGCGIAPISHWVATHRPARWRWFHLVDVPS